MILILSLFIAFFAVRGFRYQVTTDGFVIGNTDLFIWLPLFVYFAYVLSRVFRDRDRRRMLTSGFFGAVIGVFYVLGLSLEKLGSIAWMRQNFGYLANVLNLCFSYALLYASFAWLAFGWLKNQAEKNAGREKPAFSFKRVLVFWLILVLIYLPFFLFMYPGVVTQDTADQIDDAITVEGIRDHHSAFLTLMMRLVILPVRGLTGSLLTGVAACSFLQMLIMTFVFAVSYEWLRRSLVHPLLRTGLFLWFALYPINNIYSVTLWKDILFSVGFLAFMLCVDAAAENEAAFFGSRKKMILTAVLLTLLPLMRHNGISIVILTLVCMLIRFKGFRKQVLLVGGGFALLFGIWKLALLPALNVTTIDSSHVYSVLEQQMARALREHHEELSEAELLKYTAYFDIPDIWTRYNPLLSDSVKKHFLTDRFQEDPASFFKSWAELGRRYPDDYVDAFLANNYGYWFPETWSWVIDYGVHEKGEIEDVRTAPILTSGPPAWIYNFIESEQFQKTPLLPLLMSRGACFWMWIFSACYCLYNNRKKFILFIPGLALWLGILISPVYNEYRYVYGLFLGLPVIMTALFEPKGTDPSDSPW